MKTAVYCGHQSPFGITFLKAVLEDQVIQEESIVLAGSERWGKFRARLKHKPYSAPGKKARLQYEESLHQVESLLQQFNSKARIYTTEDANEDAELSSGCELMLSAAFPQIFQENLIRKFALGAINFHPSFLPRCRGAHPVYWAIASREPYSGVSSHFITPKIDAGPLLARVKITYDQDEVTYEELYQKCNKNLPKVLAMTRAALLNKGLRPEPTEVPTFFREDRPIHHRVNWEQEPKEWVSAKIRASQAFTTFKGRVIKLYPPVKSLEAGGDGLKPPGLLVKKVRGSLLVACLDGLLQCGYEVVPKFWLVRKTKGLFRRMGQQELFCQLLSCYIPEGSQFV